MVTLAKRATPAQHRILRAVEGAVINEADAHGKPRNRIMARSIAKRAAGTLSAQWPEALAANTTPSVSRQETHAQCPACARRAGMIRRAVKMARSELLVAELSCGERHNRVRRSPLYRLWREVAVTMWSVRKSGNEALYEAHVGFLRRIDKMMRAELETSI